MSDGQLHLCSEGQSYNTYMHEEAEGYRVVVGNQTMVFEKENDPSVLRATSPGKLIKYLVTDGEQVSRDQGWIFFSCSHCQELCQQASWLLIGCTRVNNQSEAEFAS